ncbi:MAG: hypothetical protein K6G08_03430 [Prevotella sp.]|nr:hypothetical protein [Prevotella sp.]
MRRILLLILAIFPLALSAQTAQTDEQPHFSALVISLADGTKEEILLFTEPRITQDDSLFVVTTSLGIKSWPRSHVKSYTFRAANSTGIENVSTDKHARKIEWELLDRKLVLRHLPENSAISLYNAKGMHLLSTRCSRQCAIDLSRYASGVYVFEVNGTFYKIVLS